MIVGVYKQRKEKVKERMKIVKHTCTKALALQPR